MSELPRTAEDEHAIRTPGDRSSPPPGTSDIRSYRTVLIAVATPAAILLTLVVTRVVPVNHDCAIFLEYGRFILCGYLPYIDFVELNPPLIQYLNVVPALIAKMLGAPIGLVFHLLVTVVTVYSAWMVWVLLGREDDSRRARLSNGLIVAAWVSFTLSVLLRIMFGQREHLFALTFAPWLYCRLLRYQGKQVPTSLAVLCGAALTPFALLKPFFLIPIAVSELWLIARTKRWRSVLRVEVFILIAGGIAYAVHFVLLPVVMRDELFHRWIPFIAANYTVYYSSNRSLLIGSVPVLLALAVGGVTLLTRVLSPGRRLQIEVLSISAVGALSMFVIQHKGWPYHLQPAIGLSSLIIATCLCSVWEGLGRSAINFSGSGARSWQFPMALSAATVMGCAALTAYCLPRVAVERRRDEAIFGMIVRETAPQDAIASLSPDVRPEYPALMDSGRMPGTRYLNAFPIGMFNQNPARKGDGSIEYKGWEEYSEPERRFNSEIWEDINKRHPKLVLIPAGNDNQSCVAGFSIIEYLERANWWPLFQRDYEAAGEVEGLSIYRRRNVGASPTSLSVRGPGGSVGLVR